VAIGADIRLHQQGGKALEQKMSNKVQREAGEATRDDDRKATKQRDKAWDERLRLVGDANFVDVAWSGKDNPSWPLPKK
jgi:hypothetical protein